VRFPRVPALILLAVLCVLGASKWSDVLALACVPPPPESRSLAWPGVTIAVNISNFPANLQPCVQTAFNNWNAANAPANTNGNGTNVKFQTTVNNTKVTVGNGGASNIYQVTYEIPKDSNGISLPTHFGHTIETSNGTTLKNSSSDINPNIINCAAVTQTMAHEIGHTMGLDECGSACVFPQDSVMIAGLCKVVNGVCTPVWNDTTTGLPGPTQCDNNTVRSVYTPPPPPPPPPYPSCFCPDPNPLCYYPPTPPCGSSPIVIDLNGHGFVLTSAENGVKFDIYGTGTLVQMGWTARGANNAFLALPGYDGLIHNGKQLFGNHTPQPPSEAPNGFAALAVYDDPKNGGNGDGIIDSRDVVFSSLRLWVDSNHDGISQPEELHTLPSAGIISINLNYTESRRTDQYGNQFRYQARVNGEESQDVGRKAYDVFFVLQH
jgi:hypothetical protein